MPDAPADRAELLELTANITAAYAGNNALPSTDLPQLIETVYNSLSAAGSPAPEPEQQSAVPVKKSVTRQALICLECGRSQKTLKRHLATSHGLSPTAYRAKWQLPDHYPMVAADYADKRRRLAKEIGLGRKPAKPAKPAPKPAKSAPKRRRKS